MSHNVILYVLPEKLRALTEKHLALCVQGNSPRLTLLKIGTDDIPKLDLLIKLAVE